MVNKSGQVLVLVLLVVVVSLAVGLSVASRNITNLKTATQSERSQRAFSAAEGGVEDVLSRLDDIGERIVDTGAPTPAGCTFSAGEADCDVDVDPTNNINADVNIKADDAHESLIDLGYVGQIDLNPSKTTAFQVKVEWSDSSDASEADVHGPASIEAIQYFADGLGQRRDAFTTVARPGQTGFVDSSACVPSVDFRSCAIVGISPTVGSYRYLRIRPFWVKATVRVSAVLPGSIPLQTYTLESTAQTPEGITRKVQVTKNALPALPAAFDYALFSSGSITK